MAGRGVAAEGAPDTPTAENGPANISDNPGMDKLSRIDLMKIHATLFPHNPALIWKKNKSALVARLEVLCSEVPEAEVFTSPTARALTVRLLAHRISHTDIVTIVRRRFPACKIAVRHVRQLRHAMGQG